MFFIQSSGPNSECKISLSRELTQDLELKLNLTKGHQSAYVLIGNSLYEYSTRCSTNLTDVFEIVTEEQFKYLEKLVTIPYDDVVKNPKAYESF